MFVLGINKMGLEIGWGDKEKLKHVSQAAKIIQRGIAISSSTRSSFLSLTLCCFVHLNWLPMLNLCYFHGQTSSGSHTTSSFLYLSINSFTEKYLSIIELLRYLSCMKSTVFKQRAFGSNCSSFVT